MRPDGESEDKRVLLTFKQLEELVDIYKTEATSGSNQISPDKLAGGGFDVNYVNFIKDVDDESVLPDV